MRELSHARLFLTGSGGAGPLVPTVTHADDISREARRAADHALARRAYDGERLATTQVVRRLLPRARNLVRYLAPGDRDTDDLAQAAMMEVLRSLGTFAGRSTLEHWADRIVARQTRAAVARRHRDEARVRESAPALRLVRSSEAPSPYGMRRDLARALDDLPAPQRDAVVLFHVLGMTLPEVASETGASPDTAKSRIRLGLQKLRHALGDRS